MAQQNESHKTVTKARNLSFEVKTNNEGEDYLNVQFQVPIPNTLPEKDRSKEINYLSKIIVEKFNIMSSYTEFEGINQTLAFHIGVDRLLVYARMFFFASTVWFWRRCRKSQVLGMPKTNFFLKMSAFCTLEFFSYAFMKAFNNNIYEMYINELLGSTEAKDKNDYFEYKNSKNVNLTFVEPPQSHFKL